MSSESDPTEASSAASMLNQPIVIDVGSCSMKAGFAGGTKPKVICGSRVGTPKHQRIMPGGALEGEERQSKSKVASYFVGKTLDDHRGAFLLDSPISRGAVVDGGWDAVELLFEHIYSKPNLNANPDEHPLLLTEPPHNPSSHRRRLAQLLFEAFRSPALFLAPPAVLALYASGRVTGAVLDVGHGVAHCVPVYEGYALPHSVARSDLGGVDVDRRLALLLRKGGLALETTAELEFVRQMKRDVCYVSGAPASDGAPSGDAAAAASKARYQLPDGQVVHISDERHSSAEVLFDPSLVGSEASPVHQILTASIQKSDLDLRSTFFSNIVLSGGSTMLPGFGDRLLCELRNRAPERTRIRISAPPERECGAWVGGSILASLATFKSMWVTRAEYEEGGADVLFRGSL